MDGEWVACKSYAKIEGILPVRVRVYHINRDALVTGRFEVSYLLGSVETIDRENKHGGAVVKLDGGGQMVVLPGQFDFWRGRE